MKVTKSYIRCFSNRRWFTRIGKFSFYSVAKPTVRQIRRWKKMTKRVNWFEYKAMVNGKFGKSVSTLFIPDHFMTEFLQSDSLFTNNGAITLGNKIHQGEIAGFPVTINECNAGISIGYRTDISRSQFESEYIGVFTGDNDDA